MKKLFTFALFVAAAFGVSWWMREYLAPQPESPTATPPPFRPAPEPKSVPKSKPAGTETKPSDGPTAEADDLTRVTGVGPTFAKRLVAAGINSFSDLANADSTELAETTGIAHSRVSDWVTRAAELA